jgi:hypothetical protein
MTWDLRFKLPRQLMYKNMTVEFGTKVGLDTKIFYDREITEVDGITLFPDFENLIREF